MGLSYFDSVIEGTWPLADATFGKAFALRWRRETIDPFTAILSAHPITLNDDKHSVLETAHTHAFEVSAADVVFGGRQILPQPGMQFVETMSDGSQAVYEVVKSDRAEGGRCYDPLDSEETRLLVFTVLVQGRQG